MCRRFIAVMLALCLIVATAQKKVEPASKNKPGDLATPGDAGESRPPHLEAYVFFLKVRLLKHPNYHVSYIHICAAVSTKCRTFKSSNYIYS